MICNADSSAVADIEAAASNSLADSLWTLGVEVIMMAVMIDVRLESKIAEKALP